MVLSLLLDVIFEDLLIQVVDVSALELCAGLLQVQLFGFVLALEVYVRVEEPIASEGTNARSLREEGCRVGRRLEVQEGICWRWLSPETCRDYELYKKKSLGI